MLDPDTRISLADLAAVGVQLRPSDAVAIVREVVMQVSRGEIPGVPSPHVIRLAPSGQLFVEGPVAAGSRSISRAAYLLETLLPPFEAAPGFRVPGALRLILARAMGTIDVPPYASLDAFGEALQRFSAPQSDTAIRQLAATWASAAENAGSTRASASAEDMLRTDSQGAESPRTGPNASASSEQQLSISDIRRARRSTGLPLSEVSSRSRIPVDLLRQLEWGYLGNWPQGRIGRTQLVRYARASGLDEHAVVETVSPLLEQSVRPDEAASVTAVDAVIVETIPLPEISPTRPYGAPRSSARLAAGLAAALLLALLPLVHDRLEGPQQGDDGITLASRPAGQISSAPRALSGPTGVSRAHDPDLGAPEGRVSPAAGAVPARAPAEDAVAYSPALATAGSARFYPAGSDRSSASKRAIGSEGSILRITRVVDDNSRNFHARLSPDGTRIAFDSDREGERGVYVANADGSNVRRVSGQGYAAVPSWSSDSRLLAFVRAEPHRPRVWNLWTLELETGDMRRLTAHKTGAPWGGAWFPDGRRIAYSHEGRLVILDLETGREKVFESPRPGRLIRTPAVSPDGGRVIFQVFRDGAWLLDLRDGSTLRVLADPTADEYAWSPDGRRVAYHSRRSGQWGIWLMTDH
jgi:hypothetical protein